MLKMRVHGQMHTCAHPYTCTHIVSHAHTHTQYFVWREIIGAQLRRDDKDDERANELIWSEKVRACAGRAAGGVSGAPYEGQ